MAIVSLCVQLRWLLAISAEKHMPIIYIFIVPFRFVAFPINLLIPLFKLNDRILSKYLQKIIYKI